MNANSKSFLISVSANIFVVAIIALFWQIKKQQGSSSQEIN